MSGPKRNDDPAMTETTVQIDGMMSILDDAGVEKQIRRRDGVLKVNANFLRGTPTIQYDEKRVALNDIEKLFSKCGYHCKGAALPAHVCEGDKRNEKPSAAPTSEHQDHAAPVPPEPKTQPRAWEAVAGDHTGHDAAKMPGDKTAMAEGMVDSSRSLTRFGPMLSRRSRNSQRWTSRSQC
jgi:copper chaperone CopZ